MNITFFLHDEPDKDKCERLLLWLKERYRMISSDDVRDFYKKKVFLKDCCHVTVDDGWRSTYDVVFPLLKKHNIPATIFVSPKVCIEGGNFWYMEYKDYDHDILKKMLVEQEVFKPDIIKYSLDLIFKELPIDLVTDLLTEYRHRKELPLKPRGVVNVSELKEMYNSGLVEIGAHTLTHPILSRESDGRSFREIAESVSQLSDLLGSSVTTFAYPNGIPKVDFGSREIETLKKCGVELAYSVKTRQMRSAGNPLAIPRVSTLKRLKLGFMGMYMPSLHDQSSPRRKIRKLIIRS